MLAVSSLAPLYELTCICRIFRWTFIIAAIIGVIGVLVTYFFVPDMTGVDLADEDAAWLCYLLDNGWDGDVGSSDETR